MTLAERHCVPVPLGTPALDPAGIKKFLAELGEAWRIEGRSLEREFEFRDFPQAISFVNRLAEIAEAEDHHPDLLIRFRRVRVTLSTHSVSGLTENDFILAAKTSLLAAPGNVV